MMDDQGNHDAAPRVPRKLPLAVVLVGLVLWSLLAWALYVLVGPVLSWIAGNAGLLADSGKDLATTAGAGKEIGNIVDGLNVSGLLGQVIAVLGVILKPMIVIVGAIGALALIAAPRFCRNWDGCWPRADTDWRPNGFCGGAALLDADAEKAEPRTSAIWQVRD